MLDAKSFVPGTPPAFRRNPRYVPRDGEPSGWAGGKRVLLDRVEWAPLSDADAADALRAGRADWWGMPPLDLLTGLARSRGVRTAQYSPFGWYALLLFNAASPPFDSLALRRAAIPALDQAAFMVEVVGTKRALMSTGVGVFAPESPVTSEIGLLDLTEPRNPAAARQSVREGGYAGAPVGLLTTADGINARLGTAARALYESLGMVVADHVVEPAALATTPMHLPKEGWNFTCLEFAGARVLDPGVHPMLDPGFADARLTALREAWFNASDLAARRKVADEVQIHILADPGFLPLGQYHRPSALRIEWTGFVTCDAAVFWNIAHV